MKRSSLPPRTSPLQRSGKPRAKRKGVRRVSVLRDPKYLAWLREHICTACLAQSYHRALILADLRRVSDQGVFACHTMNNGRSSKGPDSSCIPLCREHHDEMDGRAGTKITTKAQFAAKYGLDLKKLALDYYAAFCLTKEAL